MKSLKKTPEKTISIFNQLLEYFDKGKVLDQYRYSKHSATLAEGAKLMRQYQSELKQLKAQCTHIRPRDYQLQLITLVDYAHFAVCLSLPAYKKNYQLGIELIEKMHSNLPGG